MSDSRLDHLSNDDDCEDVNSDDDDDDDDITGLQIMANAKVWHKAR